MRLLSEAFDSQRIRFACETDEIIEPVLEEILTDNATEPKYRRVYKSWYDRFVHYMVELWIEEYRPRITRVR